MQIDLVTLFPEFFSSPLSQSMLRRAQEMGAVTFRVINLRDFATDRHKVCDDRAIRAVRQEDPEVWVILLSPQGKVFDQEKAQDLASRKHLLLLCGHYEGVDDRIRYYIDEEISAGDYILTGGEIPALVVADAVTRQLPGVLGGEGAAAEESFQTGLLEYPHYTRPRIFEGHAVPEVLLSGDHAAIARWRRQQALRRTVRQRPDLLAKARLTPEDRDFLKSLQENADKG